MKTIRIFLASSITQFEKERYELVSFIEHMGRIFRKAYDVDVEPFICEDFDHYVTPDGRMQEKFNKILRESDMVFFLFYTRAGAYTQEEFEVALAQMRASEEKKPKIYTFFKALKEGETVEASLRAFMGMLENTLGHYHESFTSIDTVKLRILLNLRAQELGYAQVGVKDGYCTVNGEKALPLENVAEFLNNGNLQRMREEFRRLDAQYWQMYEKYVSGDCDEAFRDAYADVANRRIEIMNQVEALEESILDISVQMSADDVHGEITEAQKQAYRLFERGEYEAALAALDQDFQYMMRKADRAYEHSLKAARTLIRVGRQKIGFLQTMIDRKTRFAEIEEIYGYIVKYAFRMKTELDAVYDFISYLYGQHDYEKALELAEQLRRTDEYHDTPALRAKLLQLIALLQMELKRYAEAEQADTQALSLFRSLAAQSPGEYRSELAAICNDLALMYMDTDRNTEAEKLLLESLELRRALRQTDPYGTLYTVAVSCNNLANICKKTGRFADAEARYREALDACEALEEAVRDDPEARDILNEQKSMVFVNLAMLYRALDRLTEAEALCREALELRREMAQRNPDAYLPKLAWVLNELGVLCGGTDRYAEAEKLFCEALDIRRALAQRQPDAFRPDAAATCVDLGKLYRKTNRPAEAQPLYEEALQIYRRLANAQPEVFRPALAAAYSELACMFADSNRFERAEACFREALTLHLALAKAQPEVYASALADTYNSMGLLYAENSRPAEAERAYREALSIRRKLAADAPQAYANDVAMTCSNLAYLYYARRCFSEAEPLFREALDAYRLLAKNNPDAYRQYEAGVCSNLASLYCEVNRWREAEALYGEALSIYRKLAETNPAVYLPNVAGVCDNMAGLYCDTGRTDEAEGLFGEALSLRRQLMAQNPEAFTPDTAVTCMNMGILYKRTGRFALSGEMFAEALRLARQYPENYYCAQVLRTLS